MGAPHKDLKSLCGLLGGLQCGKKLLPLCACSGSSPRACCCRAYSDGIANTAGSKGASLHLLWVLKGFTPGPFPRILLLRARKHLEGEDPSPPVVQLRLSSGH